MLHSHSESQTTLWALTFAKSLKPGDVVALEGDLGAGKTTICKGICKGLGFEGMVNSPSYSIVHEYPNNPPIYHLDLYRLKNTNDLYDIGIELFTFSKGITLIEWPQMAGDFPLNITYHIKIKIIDENERKISVGANPRGCPSFHQIFISLGTNIEPRKQRLAEARFALKNEEPLNWQESKIYETEPWGEPDQAKFLNQVVGFSSKKTPQQLLELCKNIEQKLGRQKREKWKEREIDLDLLYCENEILESENLTVPHTCIAQREFVLKPLCDIAPDFIDPKSKLSIKEMLAPIQPDSQARPAFCPAF